MATRVLSKTSSSGSDAVDIGAYMSTVNATAIAYYNNEVYIVRGIKNNAWVINVFSSDGVYDRFINTGEIASSSTPRDYNTHIKILNDRIYMCMRCDTGYKYIAMDMDASNKTSIAFEQVYDMFIQGSHLYCLIQDTVNNIPQIRKVELSTSSYTTHTIGTVAPTDNYLGRYMISNGTHIFVSAAYYDTSDPNPNKVRCIKVDITTFSYSHVTISDPPVTGISNFSLAWKGIIIIGDSVYPVVYLDRTDGSNYVTTYCGKINMDTFLSSSTVIIRDSQTDISGGFVGTYEVGSCASVNNKIVCYGSRIDLDDGNTRKIMRMQCDTDGSNLVDELFGRGDSSYWQYSKLDNIGDSVYVGTYTGATGDFQYYYEESIETEKWIRVR